MQDMLLRIRTTYEDLAEKRLSIVGGIIVIVFLVTGIVAPYFAPYDPLKIDLSNTLARPSVNHWFGTDNHGRDVFSRVLHGARISLSVAVLSVALALTVGVIMGLIAGYYKRLQAPIMRAVDIMLAFPGIIVALLVIAVLGRGLANVIIAISVAQIPQFARLVNGSVLSVKEQSYIEAAKASGESEVSILLRYILPNCFAPIMIQASLMIPGSIMTAAGLSFLGLGVQPPHPEWGAMIHLGREYMQMAPHVMVFPGAALMTVVLGFNLLGDGLRDALDPRLRSG